MLGNNMILCADCNMPHCLKCARRGIGLKLTGRFDFSGDSICMTEAYCNPRSSCAVQRRKVHAKEQATRQAEREAVKKAKASADAVAGESGKS